MAFGTSVIPFLSNTFTLLACVTLLCVTCITSGVMLSGSSSCTFCICALSVVLPSNLPVALLPDRGDSFGSEILGSLFLSLSVSFKSTVLVALSGFALWLRQMLLP